MQRPVDILIFSDLDGTLLDHDSYSWAPAGDVLSYMRENGIGLVLATSKTMAEVAPIRAGIGFPEYPAIVENGGGLLETETSDRLGLGTYRQIRTLLKGLSGGSAFVGFGDMTAAEVADVTGLERSAAVAAKTRAFSEPGLWTGRPEDLAQFEQEAARAGLALRRGGRFLTASFGATKADQMDIVIRRYRPRMTIALGDAPNDVEMLEKADHGVIVANGTTPDLAPLPGEATGRITRTSLAGPAGWAKAVGALLKDHALIKDTRTHG